MSRLLPLLLSLAACAAPQPPAMPVTLTLANVSATPLRCQVIYGHWVTGEVPVIAPGASAALAVQRDPATREVFVPREPDGRRMMLEEILCGADADWQDTRTHIDLETVKRGDAGAYALSCSGERETACGPWQPR